MATCSTPKEVDQQDTCTTASHQRREIAESKEKVHEDELDFDFVEQPDQDLYCPITLEILVEPHQTDCCGQHISEKATNRILKDGKPCPMCKDDNFTTHKDKYFKRNTINKLRVYCFHKKSGCEWTGELGDLNNHSTSCPKRPWKCQYCEFESTYESGTSEHTPNCDHYPLPCPNQCEMGTIPRCEAKEHLLVCPLQLVECEFANAGCEVKVPRGDLARHLTENAQQHLMSATLLNLRLTRELHQKMEEKDKQITELQEQVKQLQQETSATHQQQSEELQCVKTAIEDTCKVMKEIENSNTSLLLVNGYISHSFTVTEFESEISWEGTFEQPGRAHFTILVFTKGFSEAIGNHLTAALIFQDFYIQLNIKCTVYLQILNQLGDHGHYVKHAIGNSKDAIVSIGADYKTFPLDKLGYCADTNTQYLKDDCLKCRLFMKIE